MCDRFGWKSSSRKETTEKNLVYAEVILSKVCGWTAAASESEQAKLGMMETNPHRQETQRLGWLIATFNRALAGPHAESG
jgi:hypothetical protein